MQYKKMTKEQLIIRLKKLENEVTTLEEHLNDAYTDEQMNERYDEGFDHGLNTGREEHDKELTARECGEYPNVLKFG